jgi:hypothetical protein
MRSFRNVVVVSLITLATATACGSEPQLDFRQENADSFLAACTATPDDLLLQARICQCVIDTAEARLRFSEFAAFENQLTVETADGAPPAELPPAIVELVAECVIEESGL